MRRYIHIILLTIASILIMGTRPVVGQGISHEIVNADSIGIGDVFLWNSEVIYLNIKGHIHKDSNIDVQVYSHPLASGVHAMAIRQNTVIKYVNVIRDGECFIARPGLFISNNRLGWKLVWFTDNDCMNYQDTIIELQAFMEYRNSFSTSTPLEQPLTGKN